jgi:hypothetical protein
LFLSDKAGLEEILLAAAEAEDAAHRSVAVTEGLFTGDDIPDNFLDDYDSAEDSDYVDDEQEYEDSESDRGSDV